MLGGFLAARQTTVLFSQTLAIGQIPLWRCRRAKPGATIWLREADPMEISQLGIFLTVANEKSFSRAAQKLDRTQPAVSLAVQRLESELGEKLLDRSLKDGTLTDAGKIVFEYARQFENLR